MTSKKPKKCLYDLIKWWTKTIKTTNMIKMNVKHDKMDWYCVIYLQDVNVNILHFDVAFYLELVLNLLQQAPTHKMFNFAKKKIMERKTIKACKKWWQQKKKMWLKIANNETHANRKLNWWWMWKTTQKNLCGTQKHCNKFSLI